MLSDPVPITDSSILHGLKLSDDDNMDWFDSNVSERLSKIADELLSEVSIAYLIIFHYETICYFLILYYRVFSTNIVLMKWWGAHQKSWNPAKILIFTI
jgi:hypothetical protein